MSTKDDQNLQQVLAAIAAKDEPLRTIMQRVHDVIVATAPDLKARLWYGMPGYAAAASSPVLVFFRSDERLSLGQAWQITRGNGWRILIVTILLQLPIVVVNTVLTYALQLDGTMAGALAQGGTTIVGLMFAGFGAALIYRAFVPAPAAQAPAVVTH